MVMDEGENWQACLDWLVRCGVLTYESPINDVQQLAQALRDGVVLCHLINKVRPGTIDSRDYSSRPQSSRFLYLRNIGVFLTTCSKVFGLKESVLFDAGDLVDGKDFGKVVRTLCTLSNSKEAKKSSIDGFSIEREEIYSISPVYDDDDGEKIYNNLDDSDDDDYIEVYETLVECAARKPSTGPIPKRDYCLNELMDTEKKYVQVLQLIIGKFKNPLKGVITDKELKTIFLNIEKLCDLHMSFYDDLKIARKVVETITVADCFLKRKDKFTAYGKFCSGLTQSQELLLKLSKDKPDFKEQVDRLNDAANKRQFRLDELLSVPFQRILKYQLLLKELVKHTSDSHQEHPGLTEALEAMQDVSSYVNEIKRDFEAVEFVNKIEKSIPKLRNHLPANTHLKDYGRRLFDGEVKLKNQTGKGFATRYLFLFDKVLLICESKRDKYVYKDFVIVAHYQIVNEETVQVDEKTKNSFGLQERFAEHGFHAKCYVFDAKAPELYRQWKDALDFAFNNVCPPGASTPHHEFRLTTFSDTVITCYVCKKLLKGLLYQGYRCQKTSISVHKECIAKVEDEDKLTTRLRATTQSPTAKSSGVSSIPTDENKAAKSISSKSNPTAKNKVAPKTSSTLQNENAKSSACGTGKNKLRVNSNSPDADNPHAYSWFAGSIQRKEADLMLQNEEEGTFLVREAKSSSIETARLSLSVKCQDQCVKHIRISRTPEQTYYLVVDNEFQTLSALIENYQNYSLGDHFSSMQIVLKSPCKRNKQVDQMTAKTEQFVIGYCKALFDFSARKQTELSISKGDTIALISKKGHWWKGLVKGKSGLFPSNFVEELAAAN